MEHEVCGRCGRKLKTEKSKREGFGPKCLKKAQQERIKPRIQMAFDFSMIERGVFSLKEGYLIREG